MDEARRYRDRALECMEIAVRTLDDRKRMALVAMAQSWIKLAEQSERNASTPPSAPRGSDT
jgi:hypothetical protein